MQIYQNIPHFKINFFFINKNQFVGGKLKRFRFFTVFSGILPKYSDFVISDDCIGKITSKYIQFLFSKRFKINTKQICSSAKWEIQVIVFMIMLTRFSQRIFNPMRYTGIFKFLIYCFWQIVDLSALGIDGLSVYGCLIYIHWILMNVNNEYWYKWILMGLRHELNHGIGCNNRNRCF